MSFLRERVRGRERERKREREPTESAGCRIFWQVERFGVDTIPVECG